ncbi:PQQ-binding-like beta-propeller repeat protein [Mycolicibacterium phocaicum]|uniref:outer membrane protein assembly factor BamB family protein n=1 Tax=Mycolicibacterium phocaicum TaxID=319706 RepID=UPI0009296421|nr:PQQ-binding-like beta-propeller repeat protein [Mycolicibacterium phocaicum]UCZ58384.1 PQQ-like beta-propeller repeat protein [Mycolicibacterium phocaicum]SHW05672.1 Pyrrolo-quinoline quinone [Mycobacteroides abscessus subsp. abscessus]
MTYPPQGWNHNEPPEPQWAPEPQRYGDGPPVGPPQPSLDHLEREPSGRRRGLLIAAAVVAVIALVAAIGVGIHLFTRSSDEPGGPVAGQLRNTYPTKPSVGWQLTAAQAAPAFSNARFAMPGPAGRQYQSAGFLNLGRVLVTNVIAYQSDRSAQLTGIDAQTGKVLWTNEDAGFFPVCATEAVDGLLPCVGKVATFGPPDEAEGAKVSFIRLTDGTTDHKLPAPNGAAVVMVRGSAVYTAGYRSDGGVQLAMTRGTTVDLGASWREQAGLSARNGCADSGDSAKYAVNDDVVYYGSYNTVVVADARTGRMFDGAPRPPELFPGKGFAAQRCDGQGSSSPRQTTVYDTAGKQLRSYDTGAGAATPWLVADPDQVPLIIGDTAYDFESGKQLWKAGGSAELRQIIGNVVIGTADGRAVAHDRATGALLWRADIGGDLEGKATLSDGQRVMTDFEGVLQSYNLATGKLEWSLRTGGEARVAGEGFASADTGAITFYGPTGGHSVAPGSAKSSDGGGLHTKCGKVPEMRPVEYRTEGGALVVKMEIKATCPGGHTIDSSRFRVSIRDNSSRIASAVFDLTGDPLKLEEGQTVTKEFQFGPGDFWRLPNTLGGTGGQSAASPDQPVTQVKAADGQLVDCEEEGGAPTSAGQTATPPQPGDGPCGTDAEALAALAAQVNQDRPFIQSRLADRWVAQISSKRLGLVATDVDARTMVTWTPCEILNQHLRLRTRYPEVRLASGDEWRSISLPGWWVTFAGLTFESPAAANRWCDDRGIPANECFAKLISNSRDSDGATQYRR